MAAKIGEQCSGCCEEWSSCSGWTVKLEEQG